MRSYGSLGSVRKTPSHQELDATGELASPWLFDGLVLSGRMATGSKPPLIPYQTDE